LIITDKDYLINHKCVGIKSIKEEKTNRSLKSAMFFGWKRLCPKCGQGELMSSYLKVRLGCSSCSQDFHYQRADDGPAYITVLIIGHLLVPLILVFYEFFRLNPLIMAISLSTVAVLLALYLLPRIKGALIGLQWAKQMHGF
jgi:uncharacterized protein (DUF983 family)